MNRDTLYSTAVVDISEILDGSWTFSSIRPK